MADVLTALLDAIAERAGTVDGIKRSFYPAPNTLNDATLPAAIVYSGSPAGETGISRDMAGQVWTPSVALQIVGKRVGNGPQEFGNIDRLIVPVVDAFDQPLAVTVNGRKQHIDRCIVTGYRGAMILDWGEKLRFYGAEIYLSIKFRRPAGG